MFAKAAIFTLVGAVAVCKFSSDLNIQRNPAQTLR